MEYKLCDWTCHRIEALTADQQLALAQRVAGNLMQNRVLLGRFLLAIKRTESYENCGAQRKEILRRDGYRCSVPGCPHMLWLQVHHIVFYCEGGVTLPDNLVAVCSRCHRHIHQGLLQVEGDTPQTLRWFDRRGRELGTALEGLAEPITFEEEFLHWLTSVPLLE